MLRALSNWVHALTCSRLSWIGNSWAPYAQSTREIKMLPPTEMIRSAASLKRWPVLVIFAMLAILVAGVALYLLRRPSTASTELRQVPVTTYEISPSFSSDGTRVVFAWDRDQEGKYDLYIRPATGGAPFRLTTNGESSNPAWSPDGTQIAFVKRNAGVFLVSSLGGAERKVSDSSLQSSIAWMPDGKSLAVAETTSDQEPSRVVLVSLTSGERRSLTMPVPGTL